MARKNRRDLFNPLEISISHVVQRCVRQICLLDAKGNPNSTTHDRRDWIQVRIEFLGRHFAKENLMPWSSEGGNGGSWKPGGPGPWGRCE